MRIFGAVGSSIVMIVAAILYCWLTWQNPKTRPVFSTWFMFWIALTLSFWTYWSGEKHSIVSNALNATDIVVVTGILIVIILFGKDPKLKFTPVEIACILVSGFALAFWMITDQHMIANGCLQVVMTIGYFPTLERLWKSESNSEPIIVWFLFIISVVLAYIPAIIDMDKLALLYVTRALIMTTISISLMLRSIIRQSSAKSW